MLFLTIDELDLLDSLPPFIEGVELRLDLFEKIDFHKLERTLKTFSFPFLFTLRKASQGGGFLENEQIREEIIDKLFNLKPNFFDLEYDTSLDFIVKQRKKHPEVNILLSYHNFTKTPLKIESIYKKMSSIQAYGYKIATKSNSSLETLSLLLLSKKYPRLSVVPMGQLGSFGRVISLTLENKFSYAHLFSRGPLAPGQLSLEDLERIYNHKTLNAETKLYGLIGNPVINSLGDLYHNKAFKKAHHNALYIKMHVEEKELEQFFPLAQKMGFLGLSVTMPLKEKVFSFVNHMDDKTLKIKALNTLSFLGKTISGVNTDGEGALDAIENYGPVQGKTILLLGAGGAARSIGFEAKQRGAVLHIANRTLDKAKNLADEIGANFSPLTAPPPFYDILINTIPNLKYESAILPSASVMDIVYFPKKTPFLEKALKSGCFVIYGEEMFTRQADKQLQFWGIKKAPDRTEGAF